MKLVGGEGEGEGLEWMRPWSLDENMRKCGN